MGETELDVARIRLKSAWKAVDEATTPEQRQELFKRADELQAEVIALENPPSDDAITYTTLRPGDTIFADITVVPADGRRELKWWEDLYVSKLLDIGDRSEDRQMPSPEELHDIEDKILDLGGNIARGRDVAQLKRLDHVVNALIDSEQGPPTKVEDPIFGPLARGVAQAAGIALWITVIIVLLTWVAKMLFGF